MTITDYKAVSLEAGILRSARVWRVTRRRKRCLPSRTPRAAMSLTSFQPGASLLKNRKPKCNPNRFKKEARNVEYALSLGQALAASSGSELSYERFALSGALTATPRPTTDLMSTLLMNSANYCPVCLYGTLATSKCSPIADTDPFVPKRRQLFMKPSKQRKKHQKLDGRKTKQEPEMESWLVASAVKIKQLPALHVEHSTVQ